MEDLGVVRREIHKLLGYRAVKIGENLIWNGKIVEIWEIHDPDGKRCYSEESDTEEGAWRSAIGHYGVEFDTNLNMVANECAERNWHMNYEIYDFDPDRTIWVVWIETDTGEYTGKDEKNWQAAAARALLAALKGNQGGSNVTAK